MKRGVVKAVWAVAAAAALAGCEYDETQPNVEFLPNMIDSQAFESFAPSPLRPDGTAMLQPAPGSIPRGHDPFHYATGADEAARAGRELKNPLEPGHAELARGKVAFARYCQPCHGPGGLGDGLVTQRFPTPPSLLAPHARGLADGQIFHIITRGQGLMPAHGPQVDVQDRWRIVHHIRSLQAAAPVQAQQGTP